MPPLHYHVQTVASAGDAYTKDIAVRVAADLPPSSTIWREGKAGQCFATTSADSLLYNETCGSMPTILYVSGWRFFFYSNEGNEPMHVHAVKGDAECKYWMHPDRFDITEDFEYNCTPRLKREVRQIIFEHFDQIVSAWREHLGGNRAK